MVFRPRRGLRTVDFTWSFRRVRARNARGPAESDTRLPPPQFRSGGSERRSREPSCAPSSCCSSSSSSLPRPSSGRSSPRRRHLRRYPLSPPWWRSGRTAPSSTTGCRTALDAATPSTTPRVSGSRTSATTPRCTSARWPPTGAWTATGTASPARSADPSWAPPRLLREIGSRAHGYRPTYRRRRGMMDTAIWVIVAVIVAVVVIAVAVALARRASARKQARDRERAGELRERAAATEQGIRRHQAEADAADARAREMRAEADRKLAEAKRLEADVTDKRSTLNEHVQRRDEVLHEANELDPDVHVSEQPHTGQHRG